MCMNSDTIIVIKFVPVPVDYILILSLKQHSHLITKFQVFLSAFLPLLHLQ